MMTQSTTGLQVGERVWHRNRFDVGEGIVTYIYPGERCDVVFPYSTFSWIETSAVCTGETLDRELEQQRIAQVRADEEEKLRQSLKLRRRELFRKVSADRVLATEDIPTFQELIPLDRLKLYSRLHSVEFAINDVSLILSSKASGDDWRKAVEEFWLSCAVVVQHGPLEPIAPHFWREAYWQKHEFAVLTLVERLRTLSVNTGRISSALRSELVREAATELALSVVPEVLLNHVPPLMQLELLTALPGAGTERFEKVLLKILVAIAGQSSDAQASDLADKFWQKNQTLLSRTSLLFDVAPKRVKRLVLKRYFAEHLDHIAHLFWHNYEVGAEWAAVETYASLDECDVQLAELWSSSTAADNRQERMLSARAAEKVSSWFYRAIGYAVEDVALHQLTGESTEWKTHDLLLDGHKSVDVKNARLPVNNEAFYVEHTIPRFKRDRSNRNVTIAAVVSPYLALRHIKGVQPWFDVSKIRFLGETSLDGIAQLCELFSGYTLRVGDPTRDSFLPPWYFNFPETWYLEADSRVAALNQIEEPDESDSMLLYEGRTFGFPVAQYVAAGLALPKWVLASMEPWMQLFILRMRELCRPRAQLGRLFLLVLTDFLDKIRKPPEGHYEPNLYLKLIYAPGGPPGAISFPRPMGIEDPLNTLQTLCSSLQQLWSTKEMLNLDRFARYRLSGGGILQGIERDGSRWETVLAYCGGRLESGARCGCSPLVLGREAQCKTCLRLMCSECSFCSDQCLKHRAG